MFATSVSQSSTDAHGLYQSNFLANYHGPDRGTFLVRPEIKSEFPDDDITMEGEWNSSEDSRDVVERKNTMCHRKMKTSDCDLASSHEEEKRRIRRERNKLAAAKCRQRRVDLTNSLLSQTDMWENENSRLEEEIRCLERQKAELQHILDSHSADCVKAAGPIKEEQAVYSDGVNLKPGFAFSSSNSAYNSSKKYLRNCESNGINITAMSSSSFTHPPYNGGPNLAGNFFPDENIGPYKNEAQNYNSTSYTTYPFNPPTSMTSRASTQLTSQQFPCNETSFNPHPGYSTHTHADMYSRSHLFHPSNSYIMDLSNSSGSGLRESNEGKAHRLSNPNFPRFYKYENMPAADESVKYTDLSGNYSKLNQISNYQNNNYIMSQSPQSNFFYKGDGAAISAPPSSSGNHIEIGCHPERRPGSVKTPQFSRPNPLSLDTTCISQGNYLDKSIDPLKTSSDMSPRYQKALELVLKTEDQCKASNQGR